MYSNVQYILVISINTKFVGALVSTLKFTLCLNV